MDAGKFECTIEGKLSLDVSKHLIDGGYRIFTGKDSIDHKTGLREDYKSHLININFVESYQKGKVGDIKLTNGSTVPLSAKKKELFIKKFSI